MQMPREPSANLVRYRVGDPRTAWESIELTRYDGLYFIEGRADFFQKRHNNSFLILKKRVEKVQWIPFWVAQ